MRALSGLRVASPVRISHSQVPASAASRAIPSRPPCLLDGEPRRDDVVHVEGGAEPFRHGAVCGVEADRDQRELVPAVDAVLAPDPPLAAIARAGGERPVPGRLHGGGILGMVAGEAFGPLRSDRPVIGLELRVDVGRQPVADPHGPDQEGQRLGQAAVARFAAADLVLGAPPLGHVDEHADQAGGGAVPPVLPAHDHVADPAIGAQQTRLEVEARSARDGVAHDRREPRPVVGMVDLREGVEARRRRPGIAGRRCRRGWPTRPAGRRPARPASCRCWRVARPW